MYALPLNRPCGCHTFEKQNNNKTKKKQNPKILCPMDHSGHHAKENYGRQKLFQYRAKSFILQKRKQLVFLLKTEV